MEIYDYLNTVYVDGDDIYVEGDITIGLSDFISAQIQPKPNVKYVMMFDKMETINKILDRIPSYRGLCFSGGSIIFFGNGSELTLCVNDGSFKVDECDLAIYVFTELEDNINKKYYIKKADNIRFGRWVMKVCI